MSIPEFETSQIEVTWPADSTQSRLFNLIIDMVSSLVQLENLDLLETEKEPFEKRFRVTCVGTPFYVSLAIRVDMSSDVLVLIIDFKIDANFMSAPFCDGVGKIKIELQENVPLLSSRIAHMEFGDF